MNKCFEIFNPDCVIHLAASAGVLPSIVNPEKYLENNLSGTLNLLEASKNFKIKKFIFGSSSSVYGINTKIPFSESDPILSPISPYAVSKIASESLCFTYSYLYNINTVVLRFFTVYGQRQRPDLAINKFIIKILNNEEIVLYGDGESSRDYTYIDDITDGIISAINYDKSRYEVFNLGNSSPVKLIDLVRSIESIVGKKAKLRFDNWKNGDVPLTFANIDKAKKLLNYNPGITLDEGLKRMYRWIANSEMNFKK